HILTVSRRAGQKGNKVADAAHINAAAEAIAVRGKRCQRHVATVRTAHHCNMLAIESGLQADPEQKGADIPHGIFTQHAVIEPEETFAVSRGAAYVRRYDCITQLVYQELDERIPLRPIL